jgi:hypothetical protein
MSDQLNKLMDERRKHILAYVYEKCDGKVKYGPFTGMKILPKYCWGDGDTGGKLLGIYETEIYEEIENIIKTDPDLVINYGCAEGYYGLGIAMRLPNARIVLFDINQKALDISAENAEANGITNVEYSMECNHDYLEKLLSAAEHPVIVMDCEGAEDLVLDPTKIPSLAKTRIVVELHDCIMPGITERVIEKFSDTHELDGISQGTRDLHIEPLTAISDLDKLIIYNENRPCTMTWGVLTPKDMVSADE